MGIGRLFRRGPKQLELGLKDQRRSQGSVDARKKATVMQAREQIIERKKLLKKIPKMQAEVNVKTRVYQKVAGEVQQKKALLQRLTDQITSRRQQSASLKKKIADLEAAKRKTEAQRLTELEKAKNPTTVPKYNPLVRDTLIQKHSQELKAIEKELRKLTSEYDIEMGLFQEVNGHMKSDQASMRFSQDKLQDAQIRLKQLSN